MSKLKKSDDKKHIHVVLGKKRYNSFLKIKEVLNQNSDVDVVRYCIDEVFDKLDDTNVDLKPILKQQINTILENEYLRNRYLVLDLDDVINDSVRQWIQNKRSEVNLHHLPFRQSLNPDEQLVANYFIEKQYDKQQGLVLDNIESAINTLDSQKVNLILQKFVNAGLLVVNQVKGINYYFATLP